MNKSLLIASFVIMIGFCVPAFAAFDIPNEPAAVPTLPSPEPDNSWTSAPERAPVLSPEAESGAVAAVVVANSAAVSTSTGQPSFVKSRDDMRIMTPNMAASRIPYYQNSAAVPEPGSIAGLSAGLLGLIFQVRRSRKRS